jgi:hypothetical protein
MTAMRPAIALLSSVLACVVAEDPTTSASEDSSGDVPTTDPSSDPTTDPSGDPTTDSSGDPTTDATSDPTTTSAGDSSTGDTCETPAAEVSRIEGCAEPIGEPFCSEGQPHVEQGTDIEWMADPPHSGPHYPTWETWGEHDMVVPRGNWVHNLEHGGIVLGYRCNDDCPDELEVLREVVAMRPDLRILLTLDPLLPGDERFSAIAWTWVHRFDAPDLATLLCFVDQHENHAPEDVP